MLEFKYIFLLLLTVISVSLSAQEICNDGIDNDGDDLIDFNDDDCQCESIVPSGLIPNPSFEERSCCPVRKEQLHCADFWEQASSATTDYVHTCEGFLGHGGIPNSDAPLPFPDGEGAVGFRDGEGGLRTYKEYTGSDLLEKMKVGTSYRFDFFVGFPDRPQHPSLEIAVFATTNKGAIPFGGSNGTFGCPTNDPNFDLIGVQKVSGKFEWVNVVFEFIADKPYEAIVLGPGCAINPTVSGNPYFFLDRLALAEKSEFNIPFSEVTGAVCDNDLELTVSGDFSYQWYLDGISLIGEENKTLQLDSESSEGEYSVLMSSAEGCFFSESYDLVYPTILTEASLGICEGETLEFGSQSLTSAGEYTEVFPIGSSCDSTVVLTLQVHPSTEEILSSDLCPGDTLSLGGNIYSEAGNYTTVIPNFHGCDSTIYLELNAVPDIQELVLEDTLLIDLGESVDLIPEVISSDAITFEWRTDGTVVSSESALLDQQPFENTSYQLYAYTENDCITEREVTILVDDDLRIYIPNVMSFHALEPNDRFFIGTNPAISEINELKIYDRWGSIVFLYRGNIQDFDGWDGRTNNRAVEQGVYTYLIEFQVIDGRTLKETGTLTIIR